MLLLINTPVFSPKCNANLRKVGATAELKVANPLAHRILLRVRVKCPLSAQVKISLLNLFTYICVMYILLCCFTPNQS
jgi:hypothetical protein